MTCNCLSPRDEFIKLLTHFITVLLSEINEVEQKKS